MLVKMGNGVEKSGVNVLNSSGNAGCCRAVPTTKHLCASPTSVSLHLILYEFIWIRIQLS